MSNRSLFKHAVSTFFILILSICIFSNIALPQNIQHKTLSDGVEYWYLEKSDEDKPWFFQQMENLFEVVLPNKDKLPFGRSIAFLVGVSQYEHLSPQLPFVKNDLVDMREFLLKKGGFDAVYLASEKIVNRYLIEDYIRNKFPEWFNEDDRLLFYYSGHGADSGGRTGYMQFSEAQPQNFASPQVLAINDVEDWSSELHFNHILFIFDCCASGLAFTPKGEFGDGYTQIINTLSKSGSRLVITAGTANEKTFEVKGLLGRGNGVFTRAFLDAIGTGNADKGDDGFITIDEIMAEVNNEVAYFAARYKQNITPQLWKLEVRKHRGTFVFINPEAKNQNITLKEGYSDLIGVAPKHGVSSLQTQKIAQLLEQANTYFDLQWYTTPEETNAFDVYREVLKLEPANEHAHQQINKIAKFYKSRAELEEQRGKPDQAIQYYHKYLKVMPEDGEVLDRIAKLEEASLPVAHPTSSPFPKPPPTVLPTTTPRPFRPVKSDLKVGLVFDIGGRGDQSFNDSSYRGLEWAKEFGIEHIEIEPGPDADREEGLRMVANQGFELVIGVGFLFTDAISAVADEFPDTKFAIVDGFVDGKANVSSLLFAEQDGSFLVGIIAGMKAQELGKDTVGFVGGMDIPLIHRYEAGYKAGVAYVCPGCKILSEYAGSTPQAFVDPVKGKELALAQIDKGAYVIYHVSGLTGAGVYEAGKEREVFIIGVESNQNHLGHVAETGENFGLTSMLKQVDVSVYLTIKDMLDGNFQAGPRTFGLTDTVKIGDEVYHGVYYALDDYNKDLITPEMIAKVSEAEKKIIAGEIVVPME